MTARAVALLALAVLVGAGCFPYRRPVRPEVAGKVVDARTGKPVAGARVAFKGPDGPSTVTATDGSFALDGKTTWAWYLFMPVDDAAAEGRLRAEAEGYEPVEKNVRTWKAELDLHEPIALEPASAGTAR